ncbi:hypothetical protein C1646_762676 [Rhizophagus diaphanus]|nr:hypothetical protein C1646_762676 [Rhizophagus diaphanus] [Rhizophagus sp. MUCL 43196]
MASSGALRYARLNDILTDLNRSDFELKINDDNDGNNIDDDNDNGNIFDNESSNDTSNNGNDDNSIYNSNDSKDVSDRMRQLTILIILDVAYFWRNMVYSNHGSWAKVFSSLQFNEEAIDKRHKEEVKYCELSDIKSKYSTIGMPLSFFPIFIKYLEKDICKCKKAVKPTRKNRTVLVKNAFLRAFDPTTSNPKQFDFVKNKNEHFQYGYDLTKSIQFSLCTKFIDLETGSSEVFTVTQSESKHNDSENDDDDELEMEIDYKLVIKQADSSALPAKNYLVTISELDEFLLAIQNNITALLKDDEINANDYNISFKSEKAQGAGTLLVDESNSDNEEIICDKSIPKGGNSNKILKVSDISIIDQRIAKNVIELQKET